jgi:hypothetical protein
VSLVSSPRTRRRLGWLASGVALVGCIALLIVLLPGRSAEAPEEGPRGIGYEPPKPEVAVPRTARSLQAPLDTAAKFLQTAVARKHVGESWNIVAPTYPGKTEFTKREWAKGDIPVQPFPIDRVKWDLDYSYRNEVGLLVALFPRRGSSVRATVFNIDLRAFGKGKERRWLVEYFGPAGVGTISTGGNAGGRTAGLPDLDPVGRPGSSRLDKTWILVPVGVLGLALLVPIALGVSYVIRSRRAEREFANSGRA